MIQEYANIIDHIHASVIDPATAIAVGSGLLKGIGGIFQSSSAKRKLRSLIDPGYKIPEEYKTNLGQAENMARTGLPSQEYNLAATNIQRGTQAGLRQLSRMSNPFAGIAGLQRGQSDAFSRLDASNAAARRQNILQAMGARRELAGQKLAQQQYSQQKYMNAVNQANANLGAGMQNMFGGLTDIGNIAMMKSVYGGGGGSSDRGIPSMSPALSAGVTNTTAGNGFYDLLSRGNQLQNIGSFNNGFNTPSTLPAYRIGG